MWKDKCESSGLIQSSWAGEKTLTPRDNFDIFTKDHHSSKPRAQASNSVLDSEMYCKPRITKFIFAAIAGSVIVLFLYSSTHVFNTVHWGLAPMSWDLLHEERSVVVFPPNSIEVINQQGLPLCDFRDLGKNKSNVLLVVIISTAPLRRDRRDAIRLTWWQYCSSDEVACHFFTDGLVTDEEIQRELSEEALRNNDMKFQPLLGGREFGHRFLFHLQWAMARYNFQYFLRLDDDYFVCLRKLLNELSNFRPKKNLCWGHFHCQAKMGWMDESWMLFSHDIVETFLQQDARTMLCHAHAGQQIAMWLNDISQRLYFHDERLDFNGNRFNQKNTNVCDTFIGIHKAYATRMVQLGTDSADDAKPVPPLPDYSSYCKFDTFDYKKMGARFFFEPKPCAEGPSWVKNHRMWIGDEGKVRKSTYTGSKTP